MTHEIPTATIPRKAPIAKSIVRGNGTPEIAEPTLPEHRQKQVEAGLATYQTVLAERDDLERKLHQANLKIEEMSVQLNSLNSLTNMLESGFKSKELEMEDRLARHQRERDEAVTRAAKLEATLANMFAMLADAMNGGINESDHRG